ncbi:MAG: hypothetical protein GY814_08600, partial [Gammaproteobacteria bacterium]|nr:hypothetical protein [Gammaproteobacteria bacterium]
YLHTDHLATPRKATNEAGQVVWQWDSEAFGNALPVSADGTEVDLRFPGQQYDGESGLYYNYFRYYDPSTGRYITSDPIGLAGGHNTYGYVGGNPVSNVDPDGKLFWRLALAGGQQAGKRWIAPGINRVLQVTIGVPSLGILIYEIINEEAVPDFPSDYGEDECGKWECTGYGQYELIGANKTVVRGGYFVAYGKMESIAAHNWKKKVQAAAPRGYTARHIRPRCKKVQ